MATGDGQVVVVFNGEIYNFQDLRRELEARGHRFRTASDTEVLLEGYRAHGPGILERLNGMFAFALYDLPRQRLFLARDRFGKKPLFYFDDPAREAFVFASELTGLFPHPAVRPRIDVSQVPTYFSYGYVPAPGSLIEGVRKLPAAHALTIDLATGRRRLFPYWKPAYHPKFRLDGDTKDLADGLRTRLEEAVRRRLISDVPLGVFLSGGIDSSVIASLAARQVPRGRLQTFSIGFTEASFDESPHARRMAAFLGSEHHEKKFSEQDLLATVPRALRGLDEPMADASLLPTLVLAEFAREHVTVALSGDGGDELFAGYDPFRAQKLAGLLEGRIPARLITGLERLVNLLPASERNLSLDFALKRFLRGLAHPPDIRHGVWMAPLFPEQMAAAFGRSWPADDLLARVKEYFHEADARQDLDRFIHVWVRTYLQDDILTKLDRATMAVSLEGRCPFLDPGVFEYAARLPTGWKYRKRLLKQAAIPLLPPDILARGKKGFGIPLTRWLKRGLRDLLEEAARPAGLARFGLDAGFVTACKDDHLAGRADHRLFLWALMVLWFWAERLPARHG